jgi:hypothetical protein
MPRECIKSLPGAALLFASTRKSDACRDERLEGQSVRRLAEGTAFQQHVVAATPKAHSFRSTLKD